MAKYSYEFKKQIVMEYLNGKGGQDYLGKKYGISDPKLVKGWVKNYQTYGDEGLKRSRMKKKNSFDYKLHVVELYLTKGYSPSINEQNQSNNGLMLEDNLQLYAETRTIAEQLGKGDYL